MHEDYAPKEEASTQKVRCDIISLLPEEWDTVNAGGKEEKEIFELTLADLDQTHRSLHDIMCKLLRMQVRVQFDGDDSADAVHANPYDIQDFACTF